MTLISAIISCYDIKSTGNSNKHEHVGPHKTKTLCTPKETSEGEKREITESDNICKLYIK